MANTATNVSTGKPKISGGVWVAPLGTTLPTDATVDLDSAFVCLGYVSEDGLENNNEMDVSEIKAWGGAIVYRSLTQLNDNFVLKLIESENKDVLKSVYGDSNVTDITVDDDPSSPGTSTHTEIKVDIKAEDPQEKIWVFELSMRGGKVKRIVIPDGAITSRETITYSDEDAIAYGITVSAYPDAAGSTHKEYIA